MKLRRRVDDTPKRDNSGSRENNVESTGSTFIELTPEAVAAIKHLGKITGKNSLLAVLSDALKMYEWVLREQTSEKKLIAVHEPELSHDSAGSEEIELANFIVDKNEAESYFNSRGA